MSGEAETPWAMVQRLRAENMAIEQIVGALKERGLSDDELEALLSDDTDFLRWLRTQRQKEDVKAVQPSSSTGASTYRLMFIAACLLCAAVVLGAVEGVAGLLGLLALAPALIALGFEARWGRRRALLRVGVMMVCFFMLIPVVAFTVEWSSGRAAGTLLFFIGATLVALHAKEQEHLRVVRDFAPNATLFERGDFQFAVTWANRSYGPGEHVEIRFVIQNAVDVARSVRLEVNGSAQSFKGIGHIQHLSAGSIVELIVPAVVPVIAHPAFNVFVDAIPVGPDAGHRVVQVAGAAWVSPRIDPLAVNVAGAITLMTVGVGVFQNGRGGVVPIRIDEARATQFTERPVLVRELYTPDANDVLVAARA